MYLLDNILERELGELVDGGIDGQIFNIGMKTGIGLVRNYFKGVNDKSDLKEFYEIKNELEEKKMAIDGFKRSFLKQFKGCNRMLDEWGL